MWIFKRLFVSEDLDWNIQPEVNVDESDLACYVTKQQYKSIMDWDQTALHRAVQEQHDRCWFNIKRLLWE